MNLVKITDNFMVDPSEVSALEAYEHWQSDPSPSGSSWLDHAGTIVIQKCGRKTYLKGVTVAECAEKLSPKTYESGEKS